MHDDAQAGVTIHWMDPGIDTGDIVAMSTFPLARGRASRELYFDLAGRAADLVSQVLADVAAGAAPRKAQSPDGASYQSAKDIARAFVPFADWPSERVWHVLRGLGDQFTGLVRDPGGARLPHGQATGYQLADDVRRGDIDILPSGFALHCRDGIVSLERREAK
jgi:methionyl-tRNA formyltransferase